MANHCGNKTGCSILPALHCRFIARYIRLSTMPAARFAAQRKAKAQIAARHETLDEEQLLDSTTALAHLRCNAMKSAWVTR